MGSGASLCQGPVSPMEFCQAFVPKGVCGFRRSGVLLIVKASPSLRILDCQEGHFFVQEEISEIVSNNCNLTSLIIPYAFVDDNTFLFIIERLQNLTYICVCETRFSSMCGLNDI